MREGVCARDRAGGGGMSVSFRKMVYEKIGRKPFSLFLQSIFQSTEMVFSLTSILHKQTSANTENVFWKIFYNETNEA